MCTWLLAFSFALFPYQQPLTHAETASFEISKDSPVLEWFGPAVHFQYRLESMHSVLHVGAESEALDLKIRLRLPAFTPTGAAALTTRPREEKVAEVAGFRTLDDPFQVIEVYGGGTLDVWIGSEDGAFGAGTIRIFEAIETDATEAAKSIAGTARREADGLRAAGDLAGQRARLAGAIQELLAIEGASRSRRVQDELKTLSVTARELGDLEATLLARQSVLSFSLAALPDLHPDLDDARTLMAEILYTVGDYETARTLKETVLATRQRVLPPGDPEIEAARFNLSATLSALGDLTGARFQMEQVIESFQKRLPPDDFSLQVARLNLGSLLLELSELEDARGLLESATEVLERIVPAEHPAVLAARENYAIVLMATGEWKACRGVLERNIAIMEKVVPDNSPQLNASRQNLAAVLAEDGDLEGAARLLERCVTGHREVYPADSLELRKAVVALAGIRARLGELEPARVLAREALEVTRRNVRRFGLYAPREIEAFARAQIANTAQCFEIFQGRGDVTEDAAGVALAFETIESIRSATSSAYRLSRILGDDERFTALRAALADASQEVSRHAATGAGRASFSEAVHARDRIERDVAARVAADPRASHLVPETDPKKLAEQLKPDQAIVSFWRFREGFYSGPLAEGAPRYVAFVIRPEHPFESVLLEGAPVIDEAIRTWRSTLGSGGAENQVLASRLGQVVRRHAFDPLRAALGEAKHLIVVPDGGLHLVPFEALPDEDGVIGDHYRVRYRLTAGELDSERGASVSTPSLLALGGIDFDGEVGPMEPGTGVSSAVLRASSPTSFAPLKSTLAEVESIASAFREAGGTAKILSGDAATRATFVAEAPRAQFLHLATHGWFALDSIPETDDGERSSLRSQVEGIAPSLLCGLAFAGANVAVRDGERLTAILTADELQLLDLSACELAVLSACETNAGLLRSGQGIASLQRALHTAGARTAITSLWKVPDGPTQVLMTELYREHLEEGVPLDEALWRAKQHLREAKDDGGRPKYTTRDWAAWVLSGEG